VPEADLNAFICLSSDYSVKGRSAGLLNSWPSRLVSLATLASNPRHIKQIVYPHSTATPVQIPPPVSVDSLAGQRRFCLADKFFLQFSMVHHCLSSTF